MANRDLEDLLASDDELPNVYEEDADLPAYQNDNRFDIIDFPWINDKKVLEQCLSNNISSSSSSKGKGLLKPQQDDKAKTTNKNKNIEKSREKKLLTKGILSKCDIFCVKCIATFSTDTTLLWFIKFLMQKDMLSDYQFLKSCLVQDYGNVNSSKKEHYFIDNETHNIQIVVK